MASGDNAFSIWGRVGEEHLQCPSCQDYYRQPKLLSCQHSACEACLIKEKISGVARVECPVCWEATALPEDGGVSGLRSNFKLMDMVEDALKRHQQEKRAVRVCQTHRWMESALYCETCGKFICDMCTKEAHHDPGSGHEYRSVAETASRARQTAARSLSATQTSLKDIENKLKSIEDLETNLGANAEEARQELDETANKEIDKIKVAKRRIKDNIDVIEKQRMAGLAARMRDCLALTEAMKTAVDAYIRKTDSGNYDTDYDFVSLCSEIAELEKLSEKKIPAVDSALAVLKFKKNETERTISLGTLVTE